jgi:hypothetical protein
MQHFEMPSGYSSRADWWREGEAKTFAALQGSSKHIIYISDTPHPQRDIPSCIAAGRIDQLELSITSVTGGEIRVDIDALLEVFTTRVEKVIDGTRFISASK